MQTPNKTEIKGKINKAKGAVKETVGHALGNRNLEQQGATDRRKGSRQENMGKARRKIGDVVKGLGKTIRG